MIPPSRVSLVFVFVKINAYVIVQSKIIYNLEYWILLERERRGGLDMTRAKDALVESYCTYVYVY